MSNSKNWFDVDRKGLAKLLERRGGKAWVIFELLSNAWDEDGCTEVAVEIEAIEGRPEAWLTVTDNVPNGFADVTHAFTLFAESRKKADATKRGRFNFGEKLVLAACTEATIKTTTAAFSFGPEGRKVLKQRTPKGSEFCGILRITRDELKAVLDDVLALIPPIGIKTTVNSVELLARSVVTSFEATLPTEINDGEGVLRRSARATTVNLYEPRPGETPTLYELGIPVVALPDDRFHIVVGQKIPLSMERDSVTPSFLRHLRAIVLNHAHDKLTADDLSAAWVTEATTDRCVQSAAVSTMLDARFGKKRVSYDPSDLEANKRAIAAGYAVIAGRSLPKDTWEVVRTANLAVPAGQVTPGHVVHTSPDGYELMTVHPTDYSEGMCRLVAFYGRMATALLGCAIQIRIVSDMRLQYAATFGDRQLTLNKVRLRTKFFEDPIGEAQVALGIHEFAHHRVMDHLSDEFHDECCRLGAKLAIMVARNQLSFDADVFSMLQKSV